MLYNHFGLKCRTTPLFMIEGIMKSILSLIIKRRKHSLKFDLEYLLSIIKEGSVRVISTLYTKTDSLFRSQLKSNGLMSLIIESFCFNSGKLIIKKHNIYANTNTNTNIDLISILFPLKIINNEIIDQTIDIYFEPLYKTALKSLISYYLINKFDCVMSMFQSNENVGTFTEYYFVYYIALKTISEHLKTGKYPLFQDILYPLFRQDYYYLPNREFKCQITKVINVREISNRKDCDFEHLIDEFTGDYRYDVILWNLNNLCGMNACMLVKNGNNNPKLVAFQLKNRINGSINDILLTLHPKTQFHMITEQISIISDKNINKNIIKNNNNNNNNLIKYNKFMKKHPFLQSNWIRVIVSMNSYPIEVYQTCKELSECTISILKKYFKNDSYFLNSNFLDSNKLLQKITYDFYESPIICLCLQNETWMNEELRNRLLNEPIIHSKMTTNQTSFVTWYPRNVGMETNQNKRIKPKNKINWKKYYKKRNEMN